MLQGYPTKSGTGISIFGDFGDLSSLHNCIHDIANTLDETNINHRGQSQLLMNFAYEVRKAYSGNRLKERINFVGNEQELHYFGFQLVWTDVLIFIAVLRYNAGYTQTSKLHQANLYMFEYLVENALFNYDPKGANQIKEIIGQRINILNRYSFIIYQALQIKFVTDRPGKKRFRNIPMLITGYFSEWGQEYKDLIRSFEISAKEQNCDIMDLEFNDFPDIKW